MSSDLVCGYVGEERGLYVSVRRVAGAAGAVMVVPPYGEERKCAYRVQVGLCEALAEANLASVRFDFGGSGESAGRLEEMVFSDWVEDVRVVWEAMEELTGVRGVGVVGCRLGASLAVEAGIGEARVVLWEPVMSGEEYVREMTKRKQVKEVMTMGAGTAVDSEQVWADGGVVDFDGFGMSAGFAEGLRGVDVVEKLRNGARKEVLVCHVTGAKRLRGKWAELDEVATESDGVSLKVVHEKPFWGRVDIYNAEELVSETVAFFD